MTSTKETLFDVQDYVARYLEYEDGYPLQNLCERCAAYFELIYGLPPGPSEAQSLFSGLPEEKSYDDKLLIGFFERQDNLIGILDVIRDYPGEHEWTIGIFLLDPQKRNYGRGERFYRAFESWAAEQGADSITFKVMEQNEDAHRFWKRMGYEEVERRGPERIGAKESVTIVMRKQLKH
jgi:RimJ/RimL family protein N-acetyltransferase